MAVKSGPKDKDQENEDTEPQLTLRFPRPCPRCGFFFDKYCPRCDAFEHDGEPSVRSEDMEGT